VGVEPTRGGFAIRCTDAHEKTRQANFLDKTLSNNKTNGPFVPMGSILGRRVLLYPRGPLSLAFSATYKNLGPRIDVFKLEQIVQGLLPPFRTLRVIDRNRFFRLNNGNPFARSVALPNS
jgi:hypothetical protein